MHKEQKKVNTSGERKNTSGEHKNTSGERKNTSGERKNTSGERLRPHNIPKYRKKEENRKTLEDKKGASSLCQLKNIGPALETRQSHTIEYRVSMQDRFTETMRGV